MKTQCNITQGFGGNATATYKAGGLLGHPAIDSSCGYGTPIHAYWGNEYVYKVLTIENPANDGSGFTGVFTIVDDERGCFEFLYGHCNPSVKVGQTLSIGEVLGTEANNGEVYSGGMRISLAMQKSGDRRGTHRHDQKRLLEKVKDWNNVDRFLSQESTSYFKDGYYYKIVSYKNGYNGCVDWTKEGSTEVPAPTKEDLLKKFLLLGRDVQVAYGVMDFAKETDPKKIKIGQKTLQIITQYQIK